MSKNEKKIAALQARISELEAFMSASLGKKKSNTAAFNVPECLKKISDLQKDILKLK